MIFGTLAEFLRALCPIARVTVLANPSHQALIEILYQPLEIAGYRYEDQHLVEEMVRSAGANPPACHYFSSRSANGGKPRDRRARVLSREAYTRWAAWKGALAKHAESMLNALRLMKSISRGRFFKARHTERTRRVVPQRQLLEGLSGNAESVLDRLNRRASDRHRRGSEEAGSAEVESFTSLCFRTPHASRSGLRRGATSSLLAEVSQAASLWEKRGRRVEEVWRGDALRDAGAKSSA